MPDTRSAPVVDPPLHVDVRRATIYFGLVYLSQGFCQLATLLNQPVRLYLEKGQNYDATGVSNFLFIANLPWMLKPLYGLLSDFVPILGYRRKSYLLLLNLLAASAFLLLTRVQSVEVALIMLTMTGVGVAASDVVVDAMMVQSGRETGRTRMFQGAQWFSLTVASIVAAWLSSIICARYANQPQTAMHTAALWSTALPVIVAALTWFMVTDRRTSLNLPEFASTGKALLGAFANLRLWLVVVFLLLINFNPGIQTALYTHLENNIGLPHSSLAILDFSFAVGTAIGAASFLVLLSGRMSSRMTVTVGLIVGAAGMLPMLLIRDMTSARVAYAIYGFTWMIVTLAQLTAAAEACPKRVEGAVFAALMSIANFGAQWSDVVGSRLYDGVLDHNIRPLILACSAFTLAGLLFVPLLRRPADGQAGLASEGAMERGT